MKPQQPIIRFTLILTALFIGLAACTRPAPRPEDVQITTVPQVTAVSPTQTPLVIVTTEAPTEGADPGEAAPGEGADGQATAVPVQEPTAAPTGPQTHVIQAGDTLSQLAVIYNVSVTDIVTANGLSSADDLEIGQVLTIPEPGTVVVSPTNVPPQEPTAAPGGGDTAVERTHIVQAGENLFRIGLQYGFTVDELAQYNNLANPNSLEVGQVIRIPPSE